MISRTSSLILLLLQDEGGLAEKLAFFRDLLVANLQLQGNLG